MHVELSHIIAALCGYIVGSIPVAWIVVRALTGKDLRKEGSGNIGARNSYDVTRRVWVGVLIAALDIIKGAGGVLIARTLSLDFLSIAVAQVFVVLGHNWSIFLGGRGGRGLAPAAGTVLMTNPLPLVLWVLMYATGYFVIARHIHVGNVAGTLGTAILIVNTPGTLLESISVSDPFHVVEFKIAVVLICLAILVRHIEPLRQYIRQQSQQNHG